MNENHKKFVEKNNNSEYYKDWTTTKLKQEAKGLHQIIYQVQCYGVSDLRHLDGIMVELDERGVDSFTELSFN